MHKVALVVGLAVEGGFLDVYVLGAVATGFDCEGLPLGILGVEVKHHLVEHGACNFVASVARTDRVNAACRQNIPCRHLPHVFVAYQPCHGVAVGILTNVARPFLCQIGSTKAVEEERHVVYGLVGMIVVFVPKIVFGRFLEHIRKVGKGLLASAHETNHTVHVMGHEPSLLVGIALGAAVSLCQAALLG